MDKKHFVKTVAILVTVLSKMTSLWYVYVFTDLYLLCIYIAIRNEKIVWKRRPYCWYFWLNLEYLRLNLYGLAVQSIYQNSEKWQLLWGIVQGKWLWGCFSHVLLLWPWSQGFWDSSEDCYRSKRISQMLLVCYNLLNSQNIPINW